MTGRRSKRKGGVGEREFANLLKGHGIKARRGQQFSGAPDSPDVVSELECHIEVKRTETLSLYSAMEQAINDAGGRMPIVAHRRNHKPWVVVLLAEDFIKLMIDAKRKI